MKKVKFLILLFSVFVFFDINYVFGQFRHNTLNGDKITKGGFIDMGLPSGTLWCSHNEEANNPWDIGEYRSWGCIYACSYERYNGSDKKLQREREMEKNVFDLYCSDGRKVPTREQFQELMDNCDWYYVRVDKNNCYGFWIISNINGNSIFLPFGFYYQAVLQYGNDGNSAYYWTSTLYDKDKECAIGFKAVHAILPYQRTSTILTPLDRTCGCSVRTVLEKKMNKPQSTSKIAQKPVAKPKQKLQPKPQPKASWNSSTNTLTVNGLAYKLVYVNGGTFHMGSENGYYDQKPVHQVSLSSYSIGQTEVTQALWKAVMGDNPCRFSGDNLPVEMVSWDDCQTFITKLNQLTGKTFRLPTEAEWEFAARGGNKSQGFLYGGSSNLDAVAWYYHNSGSTTHPVGTKQANELGIYDMTGNVWEWCQDWYGDYSSSAQTNPTGPTSGSYRVFRGGSWYSGAMDCRSADRSRSTPDYRDYRHGLRLVLSE